MVTLGCETPAVRVIAFVTTQPPMSSAAMSSRMTNTHTPIRCCDGCRVGTGLGQNGPVGVGAVSNELTGTGLAGPAVSVGPVVCGGPAVLTGPIVLAGPAVLAGPVVCAGLVVCAGSAALGPMALAGPMMVGWATTGTGVDRGAESPMGACSGSPARTALTAPADSPPVP